MKLLWIFNTLGFHTVLLAITHSYNCLTTVKMEVAVNMNYMTLSCFVTQRDIRKNIYLLCPLVTDQLNCRENCMKQCPGDSCLLDKLIECRDLGLDTESDVYQIDYVIDASKTANHGKWRCQYGGKSSSVVYVNASSLKMAVSYKSNETIFAPRTTKNNYTTSKVYTTGSRTAIKQSTITSSDMSGYLQYDKLLTKAEMVIAVLVFLALSVTFNIFFCCRIAFMNCHFRKKTTKSSPTLMNNVNHRPYNHMNSQISDPERIYEETPIDNNIPLMQNGNYAVPLTVYSDALPHQRFNQDTSCINPLPYNGRQPVNHSISYDHSQSNYFANRFPKESNYINLRSVHPAIYEEDSSNLSEPIGNNRGIKVHSTFPNTTTYGQPGIPHLQSMVSMPNDKRIISKVSESPPPILPHFSNTNSIKSQNIGKTNYQLSREMMEEADTLLRTADTLLKSTNIDLNYY